MSFRRSSRIAPATDEFVLDFLEDLDLATGISAPTEQKEENTILFSNTAPASLDYRSGEAIYADILGLENSLTSSNANNGDVNNTTESNKRFSANILSDSTHKECMEPSLIMKDIQSQKPQINDTEINSINDDVKASNLQNDLEENKLNKVKGVSAGVMHVENLMDSLLKNNSMSVQFPCAPLARVSDIKRLATELSFGIYIARAFPWVSIESTHDRGAARVVALHPCYQKTLTGFVFTEIDIALKAVGGTAKGGLFFSTYEREAFLTNECLARDWGPNGQKKPPDHLHDIKAIQKLYPSFTLSDEIFKSNEVSEWRQEWEAVWSGDTGMDLQGHINKLELIDNKALAGGKGDMAELLIHSDWKVAIHDDGGVGEKIKNVRMKGEALCKRLLPKVPIPLPNMSVGSPPLSSSSSSSSSSSNMNSAQKDEKGAGIGGGGSDHWCPPRRELSYLFELLKVITGLATVLESAREDHPNLYPSCLSRTMVDTLMQHQIPPTDQCENSVDWAKCNTPTHIPFEPSIDRETNSLFLGGGVGISATPSNVLKRKRRLPPSTLPPPPLIVLTWQEYNSSSSSSDESYEFLSKQFLDHSRACLADRSLLFYHEVASFGLWNNYSSSHTWLQHPSNRNNHNNNKQLIPNKQLDAHLLAHRIHTILPDGYSRRLKKTCSVILSEDLNRKDAAEIYELNFKQQNNGNDSKNNSAIKCGVDVRNRGIDVVEDVALFNGDSYAGGWRFGRRHGKGIYKFASGSRYEGEWKEGEMVGWGIYIMEDGTRRNIRHK